MMKKWRTKILVIVVVLLNMFNVIVIYKIWNSEKEAKATILQKDIDSIQNIIAKDTITETTKDSVRQVFMPILGRSYKLTTKNLQNLRNYRIKQRELALKYPGYIFFNGDTSRKEVALTFDDGPDKRVTLQVLSTLKKYKIKGSFFFIGNYVKNYPEVVRKADHAGHLVLNHSTTHQSYIKKRKQWIKRDLLKTEEAIFKIIGKRTAFFRPPYGDIDTAMIAEVKVNGYKNIIWSYDTLDWTGIVKDSITQGVIEQVRPGEIILMHSRRGTEATAQALPRMIEHLQKKGFKIVRLDEMLGMKAYKEISKK